LGILECLDKQMHDSLHGTDLVFCRQVLFYEYYYIQWVTYSHTENHFYCHWMM
jgi:hypothetical protein